MNGTNSNHRNQLSLSPSANDLPAIEWAITSLTAFNSLALIGTGDLARERVGKDGTPEDYDRERKRISRLFEGRSSLRSDLCPVIAGRRLIPRGYVPLILAELDRRNVANKVKKGVQNV